MATKGSTVATCCVGRVYLPNGTEMSPSIFSFALCFSTATEAQG